ncbi:NAD-binding protein [Cnuibacter physcomitrellae]|uniref:NAD(P)-dependent oxidoreductase n=1 Tax=Cnuibacter physcomitrellae TaxID=1619308 RepID=UPI002175B375|nr:NAD(P)-dependent oxidoreductase [Cnuibacter physcomitrellae]MCS5497610.1 NAD-binding protein [Cnuibacter physcomitrellae]
MSELRVGVLPETNDRVERAVREAGGSPVEVREGERLDGLVVWFGTRPDDLERTLEAHPEVSWVQLPSAGIEKYAGSLRAHPELAWTSAKGAYAEPVAEHALALTLALLRLLPERARVTSWGQVAGTSLHGLEVVVIGAGGVGLEIVRLMKVFRTSVTVVRRSDAPAEGADRTVTSDRLAEVLAHADVVVVAAALTDGTRRLLDADALALLQPHAVIVNIARGGLIDTDALVTALREERIAGAALDVTDPEPLPDGHPLWTEPRALITPHTADTPAMIEPLLAERIGRNVAARRAGSPLEGVVDPRAGY